MHRTIGLLTTLALFCPAFAHAQEAPAEEKVGVSASVEVHSAYVWRGLNLFADVDDEGRLKQNDQNFMLSPAVSYAIPGANLSIGYWGAYQLTGDNRSELADAGIGAENDLIATYTAQLSERLTLDAGATYYFYPLAKEEVSGVSFAHAVEPMAVLTLAAGAIDFGLTLAYFHPIPSELEAGRHLYFSPSISKSFDISDQVAVELRGSFGYKVWTGEHGDDDSNTYDVLTGVAVPIAVGGPVSVTPSVKWAWTNFEDRSFGDEHVPFGSLMVGAEL